MRKMNKKICVAFTAMLACAQVAGCVSGSSSQSGTESTAEKTQADTESSGGETEKDTAEASTNGEEASSDPAETEATTEEVAADPNKGLREKYFELMAMDLDQARDHFGVTEDSSLTADDFDEFMQGIFLEAVTSDRLTLDQYLMDAKEYGIEDISSITYDPGHLVFTQEELDEMMKTNMDELKQMLAYPYDSLEGRQKLVFDKMYYEYLIALWGGEVSDYSTLMGVTSGLISNLGITFYEYIFDDEEDVKTYARVMDYMPEYILELPKQVQKQIDELGYAPTDYMLETTLDAIDGLTDINDNPFIDGYNQKLEALGLDSEKEEEYKQANEKLYKEEVIPALEKAYEELDALMGTNTNGKALCEYEGGLEYYEYLVENQVGANMTIDETMDLLEGRLQENMQKLLRYVMLNSNLYEDYYAGNVDLPVSDDPEEILEYFIDKMAAEYPSIEGVEWTISALPESLEVDGILAYYLIPRIDAQDQNVIRVNNSALSDDPVSLFMTIAHEGFPGHMLQSNVQQTCGAYPVEQIISHLSYSEGWAMYVERRALECSELSETMQKIILTDNAINYDLMAFADLAVNGKGWSVSKLDRYIEDLGLGAGMGEYLYSSSVSDPGAFLPYSLGSILTTDMINGYVERTGAEYLEAHEEYLKVGAAPYKVVEKYMGAEY